jgi:pimeloyl-[acyl-carrier protein] methyl ester esterase
MQVNTLGQGPDLVLVHGWSMHSGVWGAFLEQLSSEFTVQLVDLPGHGECVWKENGFELDALLFEWSNTLPEKAIWLGWSLGGLLSIAMAERYSKQVSQLILMTATPCFVKQQDWLTAMDKAVFEQFAEQLELDAARTVERFILLQSKGAQQARDTIKALSVAMAKKTPLLPALKAGLDCLLNLDMRKQLAKLTCPVLAILAEKDTLIPASLAEALPTLNDQVEVELVEGAGHAPFISQPEQCYALVERFIHG